MNASCQKTIDLLAEFLEGALSPEDHAALEAHFAICPKCVEFLASYRSTSRIIRDATSEIPSEVEERLIAFLKERSEPH